MSAIKTRFQKWLFEGLLIFTSVFCAVLAENYREEYVEKNNYLSTLTAFRNVVNRTIRDFRFTYDSSLEEFGRLGKSPYLIVQARELYTIDSILWDNDQKNDVQAIIKLLDFSGWVDWRERSSIVEQLNLYPHYLLHDSLNTAIERYNRIMAYEFDDYQQITDLVDEVNRDIQSRYDLKILLESKNIETIRLLPLPDEALLLQLKNSTYKLSNLISNAALNDSVSGNDLIEIVKQLDKTLAKYDVDIASLDKNNIK